MDIEKTKTELAEAIGNQLCDLYDFSPEFSVRLLKYSENIVFAIVFAEEKVVLRVHRPGYHDLEELNGEMLWMEELGEDTDISLPKVYRGRNGQVLQKLCMPDGQVNISVISFLEGKILGNMAEDELIPAVEELGEITAKLHIQSIGRNKSKLLKRNFWDTHNFFDTDGVWGSWRAYPNLSPEEYSVLTACQRRIEEALDHYERTNEHYGLIHGDLHFYNIIQSADGRNQIFDFDDCGYGFFLYDLGCSLVTYSENLVELTKAWLRGYTKHRQLSEMEIALLPMFILLRRIVRLAWLASHWDNDVRKDVGHDYVTITINMAKEWMNSLE